MSNKKIAESIVQKLGQEGVAHLKATGELPAIKLTQDEMKFLQGGAGPFMPKNPLEALEKELGMSITDDKFIVKKEQKF